MEKRLLLAFVLSAVIFIVWSVLFPPPEAPPPDSERLPSQQSSVERPTAEPTAVPRAEERPPTVAAETTAEPVAATAAQREEIARLANDVMAVELSNRGAAITAFELLSYQGDEGEALDLLQSIDHPDRSLPLQLVADDGPDSRLYELERVGDTVTLRWADGFGSAVTKTISLPEWGYGLAVEIHTEGELATARLSVGTGMRDLGRAERNSRLAVWGDAVLLMDGELEVMKRRKFKSKINLRPSSTAFVGFQDSYFLSLLRPAVAVDEIEVEQLEFSESSPDGEVEQLTALQILVRLRDGDFEGELLGAPKEFRLLHEIGGGVERTLDFGFFGPISVLFLKVLWWIYGLVGNYGLAIILLTVALRILLFPLMHTSTVSMRKMQKLQPKVKEIQAKHKKKKSDPQARAKMSQETMALYKQEGVNPMGGCLPILVQFPILIALYQLFLRAIELRHAPFMFWIQDLSAKDPYYITPVLMTVTMWLQQRLAPQAGDPQQQRIMRLMPLIFGIMFLQFPSGLVLYWLTNNVLMIIQQEITLHIVGERKRGGGGKTADKGGKR